MSRYTIFGEKEVFVKSEAIKLYSQVLLWNDEPIGGGGGVTTIGPVGAAPNANAGTITGTTLNLQPCDATNPGVLISGDQDIPSGTKTFQNNVLLPATNNTGTGGVMRIGNTRIHNYSPYAGVKSLFIGEDAGNFTTGGSYNIGIGTEALSSITTGGSNFWAGHGTSSLTTGQFNTTIGGIPNLTTGSRNLVMGAVAPGRNYDSSESDNILLCHDGIAGENHTIRIGDTNLYSHDRIFLAGVNNFQTGVKGPSQEILFADYSTDGGDGGNAQLKSIDFGTLLTQWGVTHTVPP